MNNAILIGRGRLSWSREERISDRYGYVHLYNPDDTYCPMAVIAKHLDTRVRLLAHVEEIRQSSHVGDWFRGVYPSTPQIGETILLGIGLLSLDQSPDGHSIIGVRPFDDDRQTDWMDIHALYRCHSQTVSLYYEPLEDAA